MVPTPYDIQWTFGLIRRDTKAFAKKVKAKGKNIVKKLFSLKHASGKYAKDQNQEQLQDLQSPASDPEITQAPLAFEDQTQDMSAFDFEFTRHIADYESDSETRFTRRTGSTQLTQSTATTQESFFEILQDHLNDYWKNRPRDLSGEDRWTVRGLAIFIHLALMNCPSNPAYEILNKGQPCFDSYNHMIDIMREYFYVRQLITTKGIA